ncbi:phage scaffolding protein [Companilactobacillus futsaii]|uniref:Scaffolding protein n=2 Tax=Companilactobacillus futsaii TaxID=938155 RepID=A0A5B7T271_9LACO|nr:phage scaffolding protein [Companilactobacillus futsaii]KRK90516.1 hypothetical protein FC88_GL001773 [Companilactobacillus futsaii JCM 17355]QCX24584.1 hypothetical protein FG051_05435 [Companilactobacillus futsaii]
MERKALKDLGLSDKQVNGVMKAYNSDIDPIKSELESIKTERDSYKQGVTDRDSQLKDLKEKSGDNKELKAQIAQLQDDNKKSSDDFKAQLAGVKKDNAIKLALRDSKAKDADLVFKDLDMSGIELGEDGKLTGLDKQIKDLKESHDYLFENEEPEPNNHINAFKGGNPSGNNGGQEDSLVKKIADRMSGK